MQQALLLALTLLLVPAAAHAGCQVEQRSSVPVEAVNGNVLVTVDVNDVPATFILDTGAERTLMTENVVGRLGLERDGWVVSAVRGIAGIEERPNALPRSLRLGRAALRRRTLTKDTSVTVGPLPMSEVGGRPIAGLLGRDFLSPFDLDLDLPHHRLTLYDVHDCDAGFLPWTEPYASIPASTPIGAALVVPVIVDGRPLRALVDSGASASLVTAPGMFRLRLTPDLLVHDPRGNGRGIGPKPVPMYRHHFAELQVGSEVTHDPVLWVASVRVVPIVDLLLGADWLGPSRVWLSFATKQIFVAGGHKEAKTGQGP
jgi:hypothetical protein